MVLWIATGNEKKKLEILALLHGLPVTLKTLKDLGRPFEVIEDQPDFEGNAVKKARSLFDLTGGWCLADDSGLEVDMLDGAPGVYSARYAGEPPDDRKNNQKLIQAIAGAQAPSARFRCCIALAGPGGVFTAHGSVEGTLTHPERGTGGFGYDPLFIPDGYTQTFAELGSGIKNTLSHRARALASIRPVLLRVLSGEPA
ncbi:MAG: RdgB/HAM1 family non-canonical purine NTP pyrophosphatase [Bacteroidetes bacterium]|nr:RdgB/HAM1 family non-canonical purine NTP pyrophosphatase [Bacteroidota bacterium]